MKTAEQAIRDNLWKLVSPMVDDNIYDARPMKEVGYPFADFADSGTRFTGTKSGALPVVTVSLNIWDVEDKRKKVSGICSEIFYRSMILREAYGYKVSLRINDSDVRILQDRTVTPPVWRGLITLAFDIL